VIGTLLGRYVCICTELWKERNGCADVELVGKTGWAGLGWIVGWLAARQAGSLTVRRAKISVLSPSAITRPLADPSAPSSATNNHNRYNCNHTLFSTVLHSLHSTQCIRESNTVFLDLDRD